MELGGLSLRLWKLNLSASLDWGAEDDDDGEEPERRPMPHLEPVDGVDLADDDLEDVLGFR